MEVVKIMATSCKRPHACPPCCTQCPQLCSRPPPTHASAVDSWILTGKSGSVSCGVTASFPWVLVHTVLFVPSKSLFPQSCVSCGSSVVGLMATSSKKAYAIPMSASLRAPAPVAGDCCSTPWQEILKHAKAGLAQSLWSLLVSTRFCLSPPGMSGAYGV